MLRDFTTTVVLAGAISLCGTAGAFAQSDPQSTTGGGTQPSSATQGQQEGTGQKADAAARQRLVEARETLAELAKMPESGQLQGQARTEVSQIITNFNALLTAESNWFDQYKQVMQNLNNVIGPVGSDQSATAGTAGSAAGSASATGTTGSPEEVPPALRSKLTEFRQKLMAFGREAGAPDVTGGVSGSASASGTSSASGTAGTSGSSTPSATGTSGSSGSTSSTPSTASSSGVDSPSATAASAETLEQHIDAIADIIQEAMSGAPGASTSGTSGTSGTAGSTSSATGTTGTSGSSTSPSASAASSASAPGVVTIEREQLDRIQAHLQRMREIARAKGIQ